MRGYQNPIFSFGHALRERGLIGNYLTDSNVTNPEYAKIYDGNSNTNLLSIAASEKVANGHSWLIGWINQLNTRGAAYRDRLIITGHNFGNRPVRVTMRNVEADIAGTYFSVFLADRGYTNSATKVVDHFLATESVPLVVDIHPDTLQLLASTMCLEMGVGTAAPLDDVIGQVWWTRKWSAASGIVPDWGLSGFPSVISKQTTSGGSYIESTNEPRRVFSINHIGVSGADMAIYREMFDYVGQGVHSFWYESPESGDVHEVIDPFDTTTTVSLGPNTTTGTTSASAPGDVDSLWFQNTVDTTWWGGIDVANADNPITDLRGCIIEFEVKFVSSVAWLTDQYSFELFILDSTTKGGIRIYSLSNKVRGDAEVGMWYRYQIDLTEDVNLNNYNSGSLGDVSAIRWYVRDNTSKIRLSNLRITRKDSLPVLVELANKNIVRGSGTAEHKYNISMDMVEVLN